MAAAPADCGRPTYAASAYWDTRYTGPAKNFDWFFNYSALKALFQQYLPMGRVLHVGCGNSNIQEGMAADGFTVTNVDISPVVIGQMKHQHANNLFLDYMVADCRDMHELESCSFKSCIDKGTMDAVLCSQSGQVDAVKYLNEIDRLLHPGGIFLLISLGTPSARIALLEKQLWGGVQVLLLPKPLLYLQSDASLTGRPLPASCAANKDDPIQPLGPWPAAEAAEQLGRLQLDVRDFFFAYICTKPSPTQQQHAVGGEEAEVAAAVERGADVEGKEAGREEAEVAGEGVASVEQPQQLGEEEQQVQQAGGGNEEEEDGLKEPQQGQHDPQRHEGQDGEQEGQREEQQGLQGEPE